MKWLALVAFVVACKGSSESKPPPAPPPPAPPPASPLAVASDAFVPLAKIPRPTHVVWIDSAGAMQQAPTDKVWTGALPSARQPTTLPQLAAALAPPPPEQQQITREQVIESAKRGEVPAGINESPRGFERAPAAVGVRNLDEPAILVMASPAAPASAVVPVIEKLGGWLGVTQKGDRLEALRIAFRPTVEGYILSDSRDIWVELHLVATGVDVLALPANGHTLVPWAKDTIDANAVAAILRGFGKELPKLDVFTAADVPYQKIVDTLVALDAIGVTSVSLGAIPGPVEGRLAKVIELRNARSEFHTDKATLRLGQPNVQGDLDKREIKRVLRDKVVELMACYEPLLATQPQLSGTVGIQFFIKPDGVVAAASGNGVAPAVATCVAEIVKKLQFPAPKGGGGVLVNYPFTFRVLGT